MRRAAILSLLLMIAFTLQAQIKESPTYWVVETNINQKNFSIVRLYDQTNKLVHEVKMDGIYFDITRSKHKKMLDQLLKGKFQRAETTARKIVKESQNKKS